MALIAPRRAPPSPPVEASAPQIVPLPAENPGGLAFFARVRGLFLLACAGAVMQIGWVMLWPLSYRLTHGNDFTYTYLVNNPAIWERLYELLVLADKLAPGIEPPQSLDILVNTLVLAFVVASCGYVAAVVLVDRGLA